MEDLHQMSLTKRKPAAPQAVILRSHRERLLIFGFSAELQPFSPEGAGPQLQLPAGIWIDADRSSSGCDVQTGKTKVKLPQLMS